MKQKNKLTQFFERLPAREQKSLPLLYTLTTEKPDAYPPRLAPAHFYRSEHNHCMSYYKPISQPVKYLENKIH